MSFFKLHPHQEKAVKELDNGKVLVGDVGTGKSATVAEYYRRREAPRDVVVITTAKKRDSLDWEKEFLRVGVGTERDGTLHGVLTVDSWNNIGRYVDAEDKFFIFDEQRVVGSGAWTKSFYKIARANRWVLLSATPGDTWLDYIPLFVANGFYKNKTRFLEEHVQFVPRVKYPKVQRYLNTGKLVRLRNQLLVQMPMVRHTTRHVQWVEVAHDLQLVEQVTKKRWNPYEQKPLRDIADLFRVVRKVVNSDQSRLSTVRTLMQKHDRLIVFYNFDYELEMLRTLTDTSPSPSSEQWSKPRFPDPETSRQNDHLLAESLSSRTESGNSSKISPSSRTSESSETASGSKPPQKTSSEPFCIAEWNGHKHEPVPTSERWVYLVQYTAGSEGWNCTTTDAMIFWSLTYSYKAWHQSFGRIDRLNTPFTDLYYYVFASKSWIDLAIRKSLKEKKSFNEASSGVKF